MAVIVSQLYRSDHRAGGVVRVPRGRYKLYFHSQAGVGGNIGDALLALALPAAMRLAQPLIIEGEVSPRLLDNTRAIQALYHEWDPDLHIVDIQADVHSGEGSPAGPGALCFTGGVDSMHAAIQSPGKSLLYVHGLDVPLKNTPLRQRVTQHLAHAAAELDRPLLEMETNLRELTDQYMTWNLAFGGALAACALLLTGHISSLDIAAGAVGEGLPPDGAHPALNHLFGNERLSLQTVGCELRLIDKVRALADSPVAHKHLRVCWENRGSTYNCGVCEKCLRTMASLAVFGKLERFESFAVPLDYARLSRAVAMHPSTEFFIEETLDVARDNAADPRLIRSLEASLSPARARRIRMIRRLLPALVRNWHYRLIHRRGNDARET